ncbi:uncharacterized protein I303_103519 [Kwoniella dejecticola CBS 10117]|uniref:Phytanoyl-CoA dioxygenase n=1 Tax=Kwoniella dejecticola CBS 10117 TaxID=1296121 RepID=A0A1A6A6Z3_9TREE|nr:uncharacterized protein I303_03543 [Kwoniella dejecticola CBS 10117]OBR85830.1 hypothetical protein I303_03543 [Kwoniella dejecticola CBS 10117]
MPVAVDSPVIIPLSDAERNSGNIADDHLFDAVDALFKDGVVVLQNAIDVEVIDKLNEKMKEDTAKILGGAVKGIHWNQGADKGNVSQVPPILEEYMFPQVYANKLAASVLSCVLGPQPELHYIRSNTLLGNTETRQKVHKDVRGRHLSHPYAIAQNICLIDVTPENGSTELWLGTNNSSPWTDHEAMHLGFVAENKLEERRKIRPPVYTPVKKGSLILRDLRLWHAGMPNHTEETRVMLAFVYFASWYRNTMKQKFPRSLKPTIEAMEKESNTKIVVEYVDNEEVKDYLSVEFQTLFTSPHHPNQEVA